MKNKLKFSVLIVAIFFLYTTSIFGQFSRNDAIDLVLNTILGDYIGEVDVYASNNSFTSDVELIDNDSPSNPYSESWVFFSDDNPFASWYHSSRVIYVSAIDGAYTIANVEIYPKELSSDYEDISLADRPNPVAMDGTAFVPDPQKVESNYNYALIIVSMDNERNWYNTSLIYNVLMQNYNYKAENIFVLYNWDGNSNATLYLNNLDGIEGDDIDGPATWFNIQSTIADLTATLGHGDQLAVFFTGVPVQVAGPSVYIGFMEDPFHLVMHPVSELSGSFENINCSQMILNFDVNSSNEVLSYFQATSNPNVLCQNRYLNGPTGLYEYSHAEMYFTGGNYSEQLFYWASAVRGWLPDENAPWNTWEEFGQLGLENGGAPYGNYIPGHPGDDVLDEDNDSFIQMGEAFIYANKMNTWTDDGWCYIPYNPFIPDEYPVQTNEYPFIEDLITLAGLSGYIENSQSMPARSYIIADEFYINPFLSLSFADDTKLYIHRNRILANTLINARITTYSGSSLYFGNSMEVSNINEQGNLAAIYINGDDFQIGNSTEFRNVNISIPYGIENFNLEYNSFVNSVILIYNCININIINSSFDDAYIRTWASELISAEDNTFFGSHYVARGNNRPGTTAIFRNCSFTGKCLKVGAGTSQLTMFWFPNFEISGNRFEEGMAGIDIWESGWQNKYLIENDTIINHEIFGVFCTNTRAELIQNIISDNGYYGLRAAIYSDISLKGNYGAHYVEETQRIMDNGSEEIYSDAYSFPLPFKWNAIIDDNSQDFLLYCEEPVMIEKDVRYNYWGTDFDPNEDFFPQGVYIYEPIFELIYQNEEKNNAELLYESANYKVEEMDYAGAKSAFKQVIELFPNSRYAQSSMKQLFSLAKIESNGFYDLAQYYLTDEHIINDSVLSVFGNYFANKCNIELQNWPEAINWFEDIILDPPSFTDSIYAVIDLGNTYLLMELEGFKTSYIGKMPQFKPESAMSHLNYAHYLLSLLPGDNNKKLLGKNVPNNNNKLLKNIPNPFSDGTQIFYNLGTTASVVIEVYDYTGRCIKSYKQGTQDKGIYYVDFLNGNLPSGIYLYSLKINGKLSDIKKMTLVR